MAAVKTFEQAKRIVIKIGSALLVDPQKQAVRQDWLQALAEDVAALRTQEKEVVIVSSGSIALGKEILGIGDEVASLEASQAAAAVGQIALARSYEEALAAHQVKTGQILLTSEDGENRRRYLNTQATIETLLRFGVVPIVNENDTVATDEIRFGDNDRLAAQLAVMASADILVLLSDVDGLYTGNPKTNADAKHLEEVHEITSEIEAMAQGAGSEYAKGGMHTKLLAAKTAMSGGVTMVITRGDLINPLKLLENGARATWFLPRTDGAHARKNWIRGMKTRGSIEVDHGALSALKKGSSLLAAGCVKISGDFHRGDAVDILCDGTFVARGLSAYDSHEAQKILRAKSGDIERILGYAGRGAMVHRDNLVLL